MHEYMTRHMVALREFHYADTALKAGDPFLATPDDAAYLTRAGRARDGKPEAVVVAPVVAPVVVVAEEAEPEVEAVQQETAEAAPVADVPEDEEPVAPVRRRGRPRRNP